MSIDNWNIDSILSRSGYTADGTLSKYGRERCIQHVIGNSLENAFGVMDHLEWLIEDRGNRMPRARVLWAEDKRYVIDLINSGVLIGKVPELRLRDTFVREKRDIFEKHRENFNYNA